MLYQHTPTAVAAALLLLTCTSLAAAGAVVATRHGGGGCDSTSSAFDYMLLVQQWPEYAGKDIDFFTLHGM